jgi:hypothetical protein
VFLGDPIATILPSEDKLTDHPDSSPAASPSISDPICIWEYKNNGARRVIKVRQIF